MSITSIVHRGHLTEIEGLIEKTKDEIEKCEVACRKGLTELQEALKKRDDAYDKARRAVDSCAHVVKLKTEEYEAGHRNFFHSGQYVIASLDELRQLKRCMAVIVNFILHHGHVSYSGDYKTTYTSAPASKHPDSRKIFFEGEMREHTLRAGGMEVYDPEEMARILGRKE